MSDTFETTMSPREARLQAVARKIRNWGITAAVALTVLIVGFNGYFTTDLGYNYVVQDTAFGSKRFIQEVGFHVKVPFATRITAYKQVATIGFGNTDQGEFTRNNNPVDVTFADTYNGTIPVTFRFRLPRGEEAMFALHDEFRSFDNLVDSLLVKNAKDVTIVTSTQYTGEEFFQGGLNSFKVKLQDQLANGLYSTVRRKVSMEQTDIAPVTSDNGDANRLETTTSMVWKNVVLNDSAGKAIRLENPLDEYGISVSQVTIDKPIPEKRLNDLLIAKKELVAQRITAEQSIVTAQTEAKAEQMRQEITKRQALQIADKERQLAIIGQQKLVAVEREQTKLETVRKDKERQMAVIQKNKELEVANANRGIQKANAEAAVYQANAIKSKGLAEAAVIEAKYLARQTAKDIFMAEVQRDIATVMYSNLKDFKIEMPQNVVMGNNGGSNSLPSNLDVMATFGALGSMNALTNGNTMTPASNPVRNPPKVSN